MVAQQDADATTNQRTRGEHRESGAMRGKGAGDWRWLRDEKQHKREALLLRREMSKMESRHGEAMDRAWAEREGGGLAARLELVDTFKEDMREMKAK